jgi:Sec-independent protein secretion pathway component TatC
VEQETEALTIPGHLEELRGALLRALIGIALLSFSLSSLRPDLLIFWLSRLRAGKLQAIEVTETISVYMRVPCWLV